MSEQPFILGVNYWPRRKAMYWWSDFDAKEVREEFSLIAGLGMGMVRIFLLWEDWQPTPETVNAAALRDLETVCDIAADLGLSLNVTFFTGHMSGPSWAPGWMLLPDRPMDPRVMQVVSGGEIVDCGYCNPFTDPLVTKAAELLLTTVVTSLKDHPAVGVWNLGNEPDLFAWPADAAQGRSWTRRMTGLIKAIDPETAVTCGLHVASLLEDNGLRVNDVFAEVDLPVMHGYPMYIDWAKGPLDPHFVPYLCALTSALSGGKPTLMEELAAVPRLRASRRRSGNGPPMVGRVASSWLQKKILPIILDRCCRTWWRWGRRARCSGASPTTSRRCGTNRLVWKPIMSASSAWCVPMVRSSPTPR